MSAYSGSARHSGSRLSLALVALTLSAAACTASAGTSPSATASPSAARIVASPSPSLTASPDPTSASADPSEFVPPSPVCPSPPGPVVVPNFHVSVGASPAILATRGSSTLVTCTSTAAADAIPIDPVKAIVAKRGDSLSVAVSAGWQIIHWVESDRPATGDGGNVRPGTETSGRPTQITVPVPDRPGDSIAFYHLDVVRDDGRVVGWVEVFVRVRLPA